MLDATNFGLVAAFDAIPAGDGGTWRQLGRVLGAIAFGWALVFVYHTESSRSALTTGASDGGGPRGCSACASSGTRSAYLCQDWTGFADLLGRVILGHFLINLGMLVVCNGVIKEDLTRSLAMIVSVFSFAFLGLEQFDDGPGPAAPLGSGPGGVSAPGPVRGAPRQPPTCRPAPRRPCIHNERTSTVKGSDG